MRTSAVQAALAAVAIAVALAACRSPGASPAPPTIAERIAFYRSRAEADPRHAPARTLLGQALLEQARRTLDPVTVREARRALEESISIQPSLPAYATLSALEGFAHRFERSLEWAQRVQRADPAATEILSLVVEAHLGLGQEAAAREALEKASDPETFHVLAAWGHFHAEREEYRDAARAFRRAAGSRRAAELVSLRLWALVLEAGAYLDGGFPDAAEPVLREAERIDPGDPLLLVHRSELEEARGELGKALERCRGVLAERQDPFVEARAFSVCRRLGRAEDCDHHFTRARAGFQRVLDAGERYTLEAQARLLAAAGVDLDLALDLARRNLEVKRDRAARETLELVSAASGRAADRSATTADR